MIILGKCEFLNPGGSVKDRVAVQIIEEALESGQLRKGGIVTEGSVGSTAISFATVAPAYGCKCHVIIPDDVVIEKTNFASLKPGETQAHKAPMDNNLVRHPYSSKEHKISLKTQSNIPRKQDNLEVQEECHDEEYMTKQKMETVVQPQDQVQERTVQVTIYQNSRKTLSDPPFLPSSNRPRAALILRRRAAIIPLNTYSRQSGKPKRVENFLKLKPLNRLLSTRFLNRHFSPYP
ncbi:hypothetical protein RYX36_005476, partial [Vicia faba]